MKPSRKIILITGASSGIGRASAIYLSKNGFIVYAGTRTPNRLLNLKSKTLIPLKLDITDSKSVKSALENIKKVDVLINNAGYGLISTVEDVTEEEMFEQFNVNLFGVIRVTKEIIPIMRRGGGGVIINISSFLGKVGLPLLTLYNASKCAIEGITNSLRYELKDFNIRVHSIIPDFYSTNFAKDNLVINRNIYNKKSPYKNMVSNLLPKLLEEINSGNSACEVAQLILEIIKDKNYTARQTVGSRAKKFIPMRKELSYEDFEKRVIEYYNL